MSIAILFIVITVALVFLLRKVITLRKGNVGTVVKNMHQGMYIVDIKGRKFNAQSVDWDIRVGSKVTLQVYYGMLHITGVFTQEMEDAKIVSEII